MGATPVADMPDPSHRPNGLVVTASAGPDDSIGFQSFQMPELASEQTLTPSGMKEEILLLSWLIVLLRTREDSQVSFDWAYEFGVEHKSTKQCLSMEKVMTGLQDPVEKVTTAISADITPHQQEIPPTPASILLSTSSLSRTSEEVKDEVG